METKTALRSKTVNFNWISGLAIPAVWPFLPKDFREQDFAIAAVTAWFTIGNILLRRITSGAITFMAKKDVSNEDTST